MKKIIIVFCFFLMSFSLFAQEDIVKFLGIPVDGTKEAMISKLKEKGFVSSPFDNEVLIGEFNGKQSALNFLTNKNKLWRVMVMDVDGVSEQQIRIRYNELYNQFLGNGKYIPIDFSDTYTIPEDERILHEMRIHNKQYAVAFCQLPERLEELMKGEDAVITTAMAYLQQKYRNNLVWYTISESLGKFYIAIYYDNENNRAIGEDL